QAVRARRRVDARNPERTEFALLRAPIAVGVLARLDDSLLRCAIDLAPGVVIALRFRQNLLVTTTGRHATLDSCHGALRERRPGSNEPYAAEMNGCDERARCKQFDRFRERARSD